MKKSHYTALMCWLFSIAEEGDHLNEIISAAHILDEYTKIKSIASSDLQIYGLSSAYIACCLTMNDIGYFSPEHWSKVITGDDVIKQFSNAIEDIYSTLGSSVIVKSPMCFFEDEETKSKCSAVIGAMYLTKCFLSYCPRTVAKSVEAYVSNREEVLTCTIHRVLTKLRSHKSKLLKSALVSIGYTKNMLPEFTADHSGDNAFSIPATKSNNKGLSTFDISVIVEEDLLGEGGYGCVYSGVLNGKEIAVKVQGGANVQSALKEIAIMSMLSHDNLENLLGISFSSDCAFYMSLRELVLRDLLYPRTDNSIFSDYLWINNNLRPFSYLLEKDDRRSIAKQILSALSHMHSNCIIHNDIKPSNILLDRTDNGFVVKVADFGMSIYKPIASDLAYRLSPCTLHYRPIEHLLCEPTSYSFEVDVWACGILMAEMEVGCHPINITKIYNKSLYQYSRYEIGETVLRRYKQVFGQEGGRVPLCLTDRKLSSIIIKMIRYNKHARISSSQALEELFKI